MSVLTRLAGQVMRGLLVPKPVVVQEAAGFKVRKFLKLRCQYCYFVRVNGRMHVECTAQGRHKQARIIIEALPGTSTFLSL